MMQIRVEFQELESFGCEFNEGDAFGVSFGGESYRPEQYDGPIDITPTTDSQTLATEGKLVTENITINPIPNYYGLITWDGSIITVS